MLLASGVLVVVPEQANDRSLQVYFPVKRLKPAVLPSVNVALAEAVRRALAFHAGYALCAVAVVVGANRQALAGELFGYPVLVLFPPMGIAGIKHIGPRCVEYLVIDRNDLAQPPHPVNI